jgi:hypothetical protein
MMMEDFAPDPLQSFQVIEEPEGLLSLAYPLGSDCFHSFVGDSPDMEDSDDVRLLRAWQIISDEALREKVKTGVDKTWLVERFQDVFNPAGSEAFLESVEAKPEVWDRLCRLFNSFICARSIRKIAETAELQETIAQRSRGQWFCKRQAVMEDKPGDLYVQDGIWYFQPHDEVETLTPCFTAEDQADMLLNYIHPEEGVKPTQYETCECGEPDCPGALLVVEGRAGWTRFPLSEDTRRVVEGAIRLPLPELPRRGMGRGRRGWMGRRHPGSLAGNDQPSRFHRRPVDCGRPCVAGAGADGERLAFPAGEGKAERNPLHFGNRPDDVVRSDDRFHGYRRGPYRHGHPGRMGCPELHRIGTSQRLPAPALGSGEFFYGGHMEELQFTDVAPYLPDPFFGTYDSPNLTTHLIFHMTERHSGRECILMVLSETLGVMFGWDCIKKRFMTLEILPREKDDDTRHLAS